MSTLLEKIVSSKREELEEVKRRAPESAVKEAAAAVAEAPRGFAKAISNRAAQGPAVIAELKKASPIKGLLRADFDVEQLARGYSENGAAALSVLTESRFFQGDLSYIRRAKFVSSLPALRKDFIFDPYQIYEARAAGADAVLLIAASLEQPLLRDLLSLARDLGLDALVEVHDEAELERAAQLPCGLIGVNNRNLKTGVTDVGTSFNLAAKFPPGCCKISESGIKSSSDIEALREAGYHGFLIGESLVTRPDPGGALRELIGGLGSGLGCRVSGVGERKKKI
jgi:indole-3-glycerol phosphate synthase